MLTPHLVGMLAALPAMRPLTLAAAALRQLQAARRSAVVLGGRFEAPDAAAARRRGGAGAATRVGDARPDGGAHQAASHGRLGGGCCR